MAFLDNSGDIILDVVLTDHGRQAMAKGDGSFQITKFAVCDEEIDYSLFDSSHASGSAYYDLEILQTPILEAFTNNASSMKTKLASFQDLNLLYLPVLKINEKQTHTKRHSIGSYLVAVDRETEGTDAAGTGNAIGVDTSGAHVAGILFGATFESSQTIRIDQGIDSEQISPAQTSLMTNLIEDVYSIQIDSRLGRIITTTGGAIAEDFIDDDGIAVYTVDSFSGVVSINNDTTTTTTQTIQGPRGTILEFKIASSLDLNTSTYLFTKIGSTTLMDDKGGSPQSTVRFIDSMVRVTGMKTGYSVDVPVRFIKTITT
jgi:hypothetical protein